MLVSLHSKENFFKKTKRLALPLAAIVLLFVLTACPADDAPAAIFPFATATFTPGTFTASTGEAGTPGWRQGPIVLEVTFSANQITGIEIIEHGETLHGAGWYFRAYPSVTDQILVRQSTMEIDAFTGATWTRNSFIDAVNDTIVQAGVNPEDLEPQFIEAPLDGDLFIPGFHVITVSAGTMDIYGQPLTEDTPADQVMLYSDTDMTLRVSVARNEFHLFEGGAFGLGQGAGGHGEPIALNPVRVEDGTWGGWWFSQVANLQVNDYQATRNIDVSTGAGRTASGIIWGVEQALIAAGGNPAELTPRPVPPVQRQRNPAVPDAPFFVPGHYTVTVPGSGGDISLTVTLDRMTIRRIVVNSHNEDEALWNQVWPGLRDTIYQMQNLDEVALTAGANEISEAVINAVREALRMADPGDR